jgi:hypothetical protein
MRRTPEAVAASGVTFVVVPTPSEPSGAFSLDAARSAFARIGRGLQGLHAHGQARALTFQPLLIDGQLMISVVLRLAHVSSAGCLPWDETKTVFVSTLSIAVLYPC